MLNFSGRAPWFRLSLPLSRGVSSRTSKSDLEKRLVDYVRTVAQPKSTSELQQIDTIKFGDAAHSRPDLSRLRVMPRDRAFYMASPPHEEVTRKLRSLIQTHINLPTVQHPIQPRWISMDEYQMRLGVDNLKQSRYAAFVKLLNRLNRIDPEVMPRDVEEVLSKLKTGGKAGASFSLSRILQLDSQGRAVAVGHRKTSSARVSVVRAHEGQFGEILVNGKNIFEFFLQQIYRQRVVYPLTVVEGIGKFNVFATVHGGGITGQADAVAHGIARALRIQNPLLVSRLRRAGCTKRDLRVKERKKPGLAKARKAYTWVKR